MNMLASFLPAPLLPCLALTVSLLLIGGAAWAQGEAAAPPSTITFTQPGLFPEGIKYDAKNKCFLVSSITTGNIGRVTDKGVYTVLTSSTNADGSRFIASAVGLTLDDSRQRVLVASANLSTGTVARLVSLNRDNGRVLFDVDLGALRPGPAHLANDVAVDKQGNAYVTDSYAPVIYKVTPQGVASVFLDNPALGAPAKTIGLNGIVVHPDGYLLVGKLDTGTMLKIPLNAPAGFTQVTIPGVNLTGNDGLLLQDNKTLQVVMGDGHVLRLSTATNWATATLSGTYVAKQSTLPTALARRAGADSYVLYSRLSEMTATPNAQEYVIGKVRF
jgi:sugar lactone lactonase YvrE